MTAKLFFTAAFLITINHCVFSQAIGKCGYDEVSHFRVGKKVKLEDNSAKPCFNKLSRANAALTTHYPIPIIFHVILNESQLENIGGIKGLESRIISQLEQINSDFKAHNSDSVNIPIEFLKYHAGTDIEFSLAHTSPTNQGTKGYEVRVIEDKSIRFSSQTGSGIGFSDAKYYLSGGLDAWDPTTYLNIWVIAPQNNGGANSYYAVTIPWTLVKHNGFPEDEVGVVIHYGSFGVQNSQDEYFLPSKSRGRTLVHELGHFFNLKHLWGEDLKCPDEGGDDDGIEDTPPQFSPVYGCPQFPMLDKCTPEADGIMFMNHMNYAADECKLMFTNDQARVMNDLILYNGDIFSLTQHPEVLQYPNEYVLFDEAPTISPNPTRDIVNILYKKKSIGLQKICVFNANSSVVIAKDVVNQNGAYKLDLSEMPKGIYFIKLIYNRIVSTTRIVLE